MPPLSSVAWITVSRTGGGGPRMKTPAEMKAEQNLPAVDPNRPLPRVDIERGEVPFASGVMPLTDAQRTRLEQAYGKLSAKEAGCGFDGAGTIVTLRLKDGSSFALVDTNWGCKKNPEPVTSENFKEFAEVVGSILGEARAKLPKPAPQKAASGIPDRTNPF
jgi:hypothetical protein